MKVKNKIESFLELLWISYLEQKPLKDGFVRVKVGSMEYQGISYKEFLNIIFPHVVNMGYIDEFIKTEKENLITSSKVQEKISSLEEFREFTYSCQESVKILDESYINGCESIRLVDQEIAKLKPVELCYLFKVNEDKIDKNLSELSLKHQEDKEVFSLKDKKVEFDEVISAIIVEGKKCSLPPAKNEEYFARAIFSREINESVDWSVLYYEMTGSDVADVSKNRKTLMDTVYRLNKRIKRIFKTNDDLISCKDKSIKRNY